MNDKTLIPLPIKLRKNTYDYTQVLRNGSYAIYEQRDGQRIVAYEVFKIRIKNEYVIQGKTIPTKECYPSNEDFGYSAYCCMTLQEAINKFLRCKPSKRC